MVMTTWLHLSITLMIFLISNLLWAGTSGTLTIQGQVVPYFEVKILPTPRASNLHLTQGENNTPIAEFQERSNSARGYVIQISSKNGGTLNHTQYPNQKVPYQLTYNDHLTFSPQIKPTIVSRSGPLQNVVNQLNRIGIKLNGHPNLAAGVYSDVVMIEMGAP